MLFYIWNKTTSHFAWKNDDICKPTSCLHHLIPPPRDRPTSVTTRLRLTTSLPAHQKVLFTHKLWPTQLPTNIVTPNPFHTSLPAVAPMYWYAHCLFRMLFLSIISTAYHLLSGSRAARLLLNWLIDCRYSAKRTDLSTGTEMTTGCFVLQQLLFGWGSEYIKRLRTIRWTSDVTVVPNATAEAAIYSQCSVNCWVTVVARKVNRV